MSTCPFCTLPPERIIHASQHGLVIRDGFPVSPGHTFIIPKRHLDSSFNLSADEKVNLMALQATVKDQVGKEFKPELLRTRQILHILRWSTGRTGSSRKTAAR